MRILSINSGSSSLKYALHDIEPEPGGVETCVEAGNLMGIGQSESFFQVRRSGSEDRQPLRLESHGDAMTTLARHLRQNGYEAEIAGIGHRVVHGGSRYLAPQPVTPELIQELRGLVRLAPDHLPDEITALEFFRGEFPAAAQAACFDTSFHAGMPRPARLLPLPRQLEAEGVVRYGFHGLSCEYIMSRLSDEATGDGRAGPPARVIIAHLGNGASMTAVRDGAGIDTTMGFTPAGGLVMSSRTGDLDPGVIFFLLREKVPDRERLARLIDGGSGMLGVSGISGDMRELLAKERQEPAAFDAVSLFCYQARKFLGALVFALGGLDTLVFTGGIGERSARVRERICGGLEFAGIRLDPELNSGSAGTISTPGSAVCVRVIRTDEELMIARHTAALIRENSGRRDADS